MVNSGKKRKKVPVSNPPRRQRMVCLMSEEEVRIVDRYLKKIPDNQQGTLAS